MIGYVHGSSAQNNLYFRKYAFRTPYKRTVRHILSYMEYIYNQKQIPRHLLGPRQKSNFLRRRGVGSVSCQELERCETSCFLETSVVISTSFYQLFSTGRRGRCLLVVCFNCRQSDAPEKTESCYPGAAAVLGGAICISRTGEAPTGSVFFFGICLPWLHL